MIPKILGIGSAVLAAGFILALPSIFEAEPASEVEPIRFGPPPLLGLAKAEPVEEPRPPRSAPGLPPTPTASAPLPFAPVAAPSGESPSGIGGGGSDSPLQPTFGETGRGVVGGDEADGDDDDADRGDDDAGGGNEASGKDDDVESWDDDGAGEDEEEDGDDDEEDEGED